MGALEIVLLIMGGIIFVASFLIPSGRDSADKETKELVRDEVKTAVEKEMTGIKGQLDDVVEETMHYAVEKTERSLERLSNEKIMAVNEYSDTVLTDIEKNHKEVMFLYDMLNDKHDNLMSAVTQAEQSVRAAKKAVKDAEKLQQPEDVPPQETKVQTKAAAKEKKDNKDNKDNKEKTPAKKKESPAAEHVRADISFMPEDGGNNNERILSLHKEGKSNIAIAKELGLGVGEVKLVIDLFKET